jgi:uncharacterized protein (TIGR02246 family)
MSSDEQQIRELVATWMQATRDGDTSAVLDLMTDDVVFLVAGRPPMHKHDFAQAAATTPGQARPRFDGRSDIQEIRVAGDWAFLWSRLQVTTTLPDGSPPSVREGHTLTVLSKASGRWQIARDANLLVAKKPTS